MGFTDLGIPVDAVESRTAAVCTNPEGECRVVIAAKGFVVVVDVRHGQCWQLQFPDGYAEYPYDTFSSGNGMFYMGAGTMFYAVDPFQLIFTEALEVGGEGELCGFSYGESPNGDIYMASYPQSRVFCYRPADRSVASLDSVDPEQKYPSHMAIDPYGWIYVGTGTTKKNIVAYQPDTGEIIPLLSQELRTIGIGMVRQGPNFQVYAQFGDQWMRLEQGKAVESLMEHQVPPSSYTGPGFGKFHRQLTGDLELLSHSLSERKLILRNRFTGQINELELPYTSEGAVLSPIVLGPDDKIYGTSNHPLHLFTGETDGADEQKQQDSLQLVNWGPHVIHNGTGGNLAAYAVQGNIVAGAEYPGGRLHLLDTTRPLSAEEHHRNPVCVAAHQDIHRPRCAVALADGEHIVYGGFPGYGMIGGGLCIYHMPTDSNRLLRHTALIPNQSTVALAQSPDGMLIGGTSIETPGGAEPLAKSACLYKLDWNNGAIISSWRLREDIREYSMLLIDSSGRVHTITSCSVYFVWDPRTGSVVHVEDLSAWGSIVRHGWHLDQEDDCIYGALSRTLFQIPLASLHPRRLGTPPHPITSGFAKRGRKLYYASSSHLWSYSLDRS